MDRKGDWIETYTGKKFYILEPKINDICIEDIAHSLSQLCRYNGHSQNFYSVAEHCVLMYDFADSIGHKGLKLLKILLHDAHEAYIGDITRPLQKCIKFLDPDFFIKLNKIKDKLDFVIFEKFGINDWTLPSTAKYVKILDNSVLYDEKTALFPETKNSWLSDGTKLDVAIKNLDPKTAESYFLDRFYKSSN